MGTKLFFPEECRRMANFPPKMKKKKTKQNKRDKKQPEHDKPRPSTTYHPAHTKPSENHIASISLAPSSQLRMYVRYLYPTFTNSRQQKPTEPSIRPNSLQHAIVRYDL